MTEPQYKRIADRLRAEIRAGRWKPGERLPSHAEIAEQFGVSVAPARQAVLQLVSENLLFTATSRGTIVRSQEVLDHVVTDFIRPDRPRNSGADVFVETAENAGRNPHKEFSMGIEPATEAVARWLGVERDSFVVARTVMQYIDDEPWAWEVSYYPRDLAEETGIDSPHDIPEGTMRRLRDRGHGEIAWRDYQIARPATGDEAKRLGVGTGTWIQDYVRIGANHTRITRVTRVRRAADRNRVIYELGDEQGLAHIRDAVNRVNGSGVAGE